MYNKVLIIGNGFDLDLGLNTRYSDFAYSPEWPFGEINFSTDLHSHLSEARKKDKWLDIEKTIEDYCLLHEDVPYRINDYTVNKDKETFRLLIKSLSQYLRNEQQKSINTDSLAAQVLKECVRNGFFTNIFSFNYTDLYLTAEKIGISHRFDYKHVHGYLQNDNIIIGVREEAELLEGYDFVRKTFSHYYQSTNIPYALDEADDVIFFGHSLSPNDYHYFDTFFQKQCSESMTKKKSKHIIFFTYDYNSEIEIKKQLWRMNHHRTDRLFSYNDVSFILTSEPETILTNKLFSRLQKESAEETNRILQNIANSIR